MTRCVLGIDIGTTCTKVLAVTPDGTVLSQASQGYPLISRGCRIEQKAEDWISAVIGAVRRAAQPLDVSSIAGISLSTQGASTVAVSASGEFIGNAITWMDTRSVREAEEIEKELGGDYIYRTSGWKINPSLDCAKLRCIGPDASSAGAVRYLSTLEVVNGYLTGNPAIDPTNAAIRQLYNIGKGRWDSALVKAAGITEKELPEVLPTGAEVGRLRAEAAAAMGVPVGISVFNGAHDQYCAAIGAGAVEDGDMLLSAGTTWVLMGITRAPLFTKSYIAPGRYPGGELYGAISSLICSGASLQWFKENFLPEEFEEMNRVVAERRDKTGELCFFPYLAGAGYPIWNLRAKGAFTGIALEHDRFDFARAVMEGVAFGVRRGTDDFRANGAEIHRITIMGGASKSPVWCQMIADIADVPIVRLNQADVCAMGAAVLALTALKVYPDYKTASDAMLHADREFLPQPQEVVYYQEKYHKFRRMWQCLQTYYAQ